MYHIYSLVMVPLIYKATMVQVVVVHVLYYVLQLPLPYAAKRAYHSVSRLQLGPHCMWLILFGGYPYKANTAIIELSEY